MAKCMISVALMLIFACMVASDQNVVKKSKIRRLDGLEWDDYSGDPLDAPPQGGGSGNRDGGQGINSPGDRTDSFGENSGGTDSYGGGSGGNGGSGGSDSYGGGSGGSDSYGGGGGGGTDSFGSGGVESYGEGSGGTDSYGGGSDSYGGSTGDSYGGGSDSYGGGSDSYGGGSDSYGGSTGDSYGDSSSSYGDSSSSYGDSSSGESSSSSYGGYGGGYSSSYHSKSKFGEFMNKINVQVPLFPSLMAFGMVLYLGMLFTAYQFERNTEGTFANCCRLSVHTAHCTWRVIYNLYHCRLGEIPPIMCATDDDDDEYDEEQLERMRPRDGIEQALEKEHRRAMQRTLDTECRPPKTKLFAGFAF